MSYIYKEYMKALNGKDILEQAVQLNECVLLSFLKDAYGQTPGTQKYMTFAEAHLLYRQRKERKSASLRADLQLNGEHNFNTFPIPKEYFNYARERSQDEGAATLPKVQEFYKSLISVEDNKCRIKK